MADEFGTDISTYRQGDLDPTFTIIRGTRVVAEGLARRLETPRGGLIGDPNYGTDLRPWLNRDFVATEEALFAMKAAIEDEADKDERIASAEATVSYSSALRKLHIKIVVVTARGPFELLLAVSAVTVEILNPT